MPVFTKKSAIATRGRYGHTNASSINSDTRLLAAHETASLPPWLRMRGGGGAQSSESCGSAANGGTGSHSRAAGGKNSNRNSRSNASFAPVASPAAVPPGVALPAPVVRRSSALTSSRVIILRGDSDTTSMESSLDPRSPLPTSKTNRSAVTTMTDAEKSNDSIHVSPDTPYLQRPVLTIFTTVDEGEEDVEKSQVAGPAASSPHPSLTPERNLSRNLSTAASASAATRSVANPNNGDRGCVGEESVLRVTETTLMPIAHYSLFGNGMDPSLPLDLEQPAPFVAQGGQDPFRGGTSASFASSNTSGLLHPLTSPLASPVAPSRPPGQGSFACTNSPAPISSRPSVQNLSLAGAAAAAMMTPGLTPRVSATPVVPINPYNETATRQRVVKELLSKYGPDAERHVEELDSSVTAAAVACKESSKKSSASSKKEKAGSKKKPKSSVKSAPVVQREPPMTREQIIRVGAMRLQQRLSTLHLAVFRVKNDGNCQFRAIAQQLLGSEDYHDLIRAHVVSYMKKVRREKFDFYFDNVTAADAYFTKLSRIGSWGDELTLRGASDALYVNIHVLSSAEKSCYSCYQPSADAPPAPSFLVDIAKIKERKRQERRFRSWQRKSFCGPPVKMASATDSSNAGLEGAPQAPASVANANVSRHWERPKSQSMPQPTVTPAFLCDFSDDSGDERACRRDEEELDANAIQEVLRRKLQSKRIKASVPFFTPDGQLRQPRASLGSSFSHTPQSFNGLGTTQSMPVNPAVAPPSLLQNGGGNSGLYSLSTSANSFQVTNCVSNTTLHPTARGPMGEVSGSMNSAAGVDNGARGGAGHGPLLLPQRPSPVAPASLPPRPTLRSPTKRASRASSPPPDGATRSMVEKPLTDMPTRGATATATGPNVTASCVGGCHVSPQRVMDIATFGVTADDAVNVTKYQTMRRPPSRLLRPAVAPAGDPASGSGGRHREAQSFPIFPTVGGGNVMLLASSPTSRLGRSSGGHSGGAGGAESNAHRALHQSFAALNNSAGGSFAGSFADPYASFSYFPTNNGLLNGSIAGGPGALGTNYSMGAVPHCDSDGDGGDDEVVFMFEPRKQPIDVFLSYLYPVHYNALCIVEADSDDEETSAGASAGASQGTLLHPQANADSQSRAEERPQFINASFLRASFED